MSVINYYFSPASPYAYLAGDRLEQIATRQGARIAYKPVDVFTVFEVTGGIPVHRRHLSRQEYRLQDLVRRARKAGMDMHLQPKFWPGDPMLPSCALIAAGAAVAAGTSTGDVGLAARSLMRALWAEQKDISDAGVIAAALAEAGFSADVLSDGSHAGAAYASNTEEAVRLGVFGSPFYIVDGQRFWGQDRLEDLEDLLAGGPAAEARDARH
ncbi:MAG: 2-hydroxychromene-2-carboxylate isomerase [Paracoccaceae bacterium]|jgi:2-hydroxychromene-2-carboxylate isomerase